MNKLLRFFRGHAPDVVALSALLDGELSPPAAARLGEHVATCDACQGALDGLRATREALSALPEVDAPRSFRLRQADVERASVVERRSAAPMLRWAPAAGAVAAAVFVVVLAADLRSSGRSSEAGPSANRQATSAESSGGFQSAKGADAATALAGTVPESGLTLTYDTPSADSAPLAPPAPGPGAVTSATPPAAQASRVDDGSASATPAYAYDLAAPPAGTQPTAASSAGAFAAAAAADRDEDDGNNPGLLRVIEMIAGVTVLAALAVIGWRLRGERT